MIETRIEMRTVCPSEITAPLPPAPVAPANPAIEASREVLAWIAATMARAGLIERRVLDARIACEGRQ